MWRTGMEGRESGKSSHRYAGHYGPCRAYPSYPHGFEGPRPFRFTKGLTTVRVTVRPFQAEIAIESSNKRRKYV